MGRCYECGGNGCAVCDPLREIYDFTKLPPGTVLRYLDSPYLHVLDRRKEDDSGWWMRGNSGGLADRVWEDGEWEVVGVLWTVGADRDYDPLEGARLGRNIDSEKGT